MKRAFLFGLLTALCFPLLLTACAGGGNPATTTATSDTTTTSPQKVLPDLTYSEAPTYKLMWDKTSDGGTYLQHRIPCIVVTKEDTVIVCCEGRRAGNDWAETDVYIQRSTDHGETFGAPIYIATTNSQNHTVDNAVLIVGEDNTIHCLYCRDYSVSGTSTDPEKFGGLWYRRSTDDGLTWSDPRQLTDYLPEGRVAPLYEHNVFAFGPGHGICTADGTLMVPCWYILKSSGLALTSHGTGSKPSAVSVMYSKDNGETWRMTPMTGATNETAIVELSDGRIMLNSRNTPNRLVQTSPTGLGNWTTPVQDPELIDPGCFGTLKEFAFKDLPYTLFFANCETDFGRVPLVLKTSTDDGETWPTSYVVDGISGGYADIAVDSRGCVYVLYEQNFGHHMYLARFSYDTLMGTDGNTLSDLQVAGTATPFTFNSKWNSTQTLTVANGTASLTLTPTAESAESTVLLNGQAIPSGEPSTLPLDPTLPEQEFTLTVQTGDYTRTYYFKVVYEDPKALQKRVIYYDFSSTDATKVQNAEGDSYPLTRGGATVVQKDGDAVLQFTGTGAAAYIPGYQFTKADFTLSLWFNPTDLSASISHLFWYGGVGTDKTAFYARLGKNTSLTSIMKEGVYEQATLGSSALSPALQTDTWYHLVIVRDGASERMYLNGRQIHYVGLSYVHDMTSDLPLYLGYDKNGTRNFRGYMDNVAIYNYALSAAEVSALYQQEQK